MKARKLVSCFVVPLFLAGSFLTFAGCNKSSGTGEEIKETDPWYTCKTINVMEQTNVDSYDGFSFETPVVIDGMTFVTYISHITDEETGDYQSHDPICVFDKEGRLIREFEITDDIPKSRRLNIAVMGGKPVLYYISDGKVCHADVNTETGYLENMKELDIDLNSGKVAYCEASGEYLFATIVRTGENYLYIMKGDELLLEKKIVTEFGSILGVSPTETGYEINIDNCLYNYDPDSNSVKASGMSNLIYTAGEHGYSLKSAIGYDGRTYVKEIDGIYVDGELFLSYSGTDLNVYTFMYSNLLEVAEDYIVLYNMSNDYGVAVHAPIINILTKQDTNPNAGKTILSAISYGGKIDTMTGECIQRFNSENDKYFIKYVTKEMEYSSEEEYAEKYEEDFQKELMSSDAPDICFGTHEMWWIQNEDFFVDIRKEIELDDTTYYTKIINSMGRDDQLFCMPLSFKAEGIWAERTIVKEGAKGFTFDEYLEFISTYGNGKDPINIDYGRDEYFLKCFSMMNDIWFSDKNVNIDADTFEKMCDYCNTIPEEQVIDLSDLYFIDEEEQANIASTETDGFSIDITTPFLYPFTLGQYDDPVFLGYPTIDGRGAAAIISNSVSISSQSENKEACLDFVKMLISEDIQALNDNNPINRNALDPVLERYAKQTTEEFKRAGFTSEAAAVEFGYYLPKENMKKQYAEAMDNVEVVTALDGSVSAIVREELSSCFTGQKDIKEVEKTLEDRLNTLYSEKYGK